MTNAFETPITRSGPLRTPKNLLVDQTYDGHKSVHDDDVAKDLGIAAGPIEGPTHFSQFDPLAVDLWGQAWFERGCISSHFLNMVTEGEEVRAALTPLGPNEARIDAFKADGTPVLTGSATLGPDHPPTTLEQRLAARRDPGDLFVIDQIQIGPIAEEHPEAQIDFPSSNTNHYPFSLEEKLASITEPSPWYTAQGPSPWGRPILPTEMASVLTQKVDMELPIRSPSVGLFLDLEVRFLAGPLFVDETYTLGREIVAVGQSRKVESYWTRATISDRSGQAVATVLLHQGLFKNSYPGYPKDRLA